MSENFIKIKNTKIYLDDRTQTSPLGREFRLSAIKANLKLPAKYLNKVYKNHYFYIFKYSDDIFFGFEFDYLDKFYRKLDHNETLSIMK
jgi:hypothetical protein